MKINNLEVNYPIQILSKDEYDNLERLAKNGELTESEIEERAKDIADMHMKLEPKTVKISLFNPYTDKISNMDEPFYSEYIEGDHEWYQKYNRCYKANFTTKTNEIVLNYVNEVAEPLKESLKKLWNERSRYLRHNRNVWRAIAIFSLFLNIICGLALVLN